MFAYGALSSVREYVRIIFMEELRKNQILTVTIDGWGSEAQGVCHVDGRAIFVPGAIPGEEWDIKLLKVGSSAIYAKGEKLLLTSPARVEPDCPCASLRRPVRRLRHPAYAL